MRAPKVLLTWAVATSRVRGPMTWRKLSAVSASSAPSRAKRSTAPVRCATICGGGEASQLQSGTGPGFHIGSARACQGTRLEWCSSTESTISSPGRRLCVPQVLATKLMASLAFLVNTTSREEDALTKVATCVQRARGRQRAPVAGSCGFGTFSRASSYAVVASADSVCTPRCTLELYEL